LDKKQESKNAFIHDLIDLHIDKTLYNEVLYNTLVKSYIEASQEDFRIEDLAAIYKFALDSGHDTLNEGVKLLEKFPNDGVYRLIAAMIVVGIQLGILSKAEVDK
jgi:hypothetical protein